MSEEEWTNVAGHGAQQKADELRAGQTTMQRIGSALFGPTGEERAWRRGAEGERIVGRRLDKLPVQWQVLHDLTIGRQGANLDHLVIGPPGVFAINTKHHTGTVTVYDRAILHNGTNAHYVPKARAERRRVQKALSRAHGREVEVTSLLVIVGGHLDVRKRPSGVKVLRPRRLPKWFLKQKDVVLGPADILQIAALAAQPSTWGRAVTAAREPADRESARPDSAQPTSTAEAPRPPGAGVQEVPAAPALSDGALVNAQPIAPEASLHPTSASGSSDAFTVRRWRRFGPDRLYLNDADGTPLGHLDIKTGDTVVKDPSRAATIRERLEQARSELDATP